MVTSVMTEMTYEQFKYEYLMNAQYDGGTDLHNDIMNEFEHEYPQYYQRLKDEMGM